MPLPTRTNCSAHAFSRRLLYAASALSLILPASAWAQSARSDAARPSHGFAIPAQPLEAALRAYMEQSGVQVGYESADVSGRTSAAVNGALGPGEALSRLLSGTGLTYRFTAPTAVRLEPAPNADTGTVQLGPVRVGASDGRRADGTDLPETARGPVRGYVARQSATATKTDTPIIETPQSISVVSAEQVRERGALTLQDALLYVPGLRAESFGNDNRFDGLKIRGGDPVSYLDGLRTNYSVEYSNYDTARVDPYVLERIDVLKGPASVLYGQGTVFGLVNMASKLPDFDQAHGEVIGSYGTFERKQGQIDVTGPLDAAGTFAARLIVLARDADTQVDFAKDNRWLVAPSIAWRPSDRTDVSILLHHQEDRTGSTSQYLPFIGSILPNVNGRIPRSRFSGEPGFDKFDTDQTNITVTLRQAFSDAVEFRSTSRAMWNDTDYQYMYLNVYGDQPFNPYLQPGDAGYTGPDRNLGRSYEARYFKTRTYATDNHIQANIATGPLTHKILVGVDAQDFRQSEIYGYGDASVIDIYTPTYGNYDPPVTDFAGTRKRTQLGVYLLDQIKLGGLSATLGVRRDRAKVSSIAPDGTRDDQVSHAWTGRAGLLYLFDNGIAPYVSWSQSFNPVSGVDFDGNLFKPQRGRQWEAGIKWQPAPDALLTASLFDIVDTNRLTPDPVNVDFSVQTGEVHSKGFEIEGNARIADFWDVTASYSYTDAKVTKSNYPEEVGSRFFSVPKHLASGWIARRFEIGSDGLLRIGGGVRHVGATVDTNFYSSPAFSIRTPANTLFDAMIAYELGKWRLSLNAKNLTDKRYFSTCLSRGDCLYGQARTVVGSLAWRF